MFVVHISNLFSLSPSLLPTSFTSSLFFFNKDSYFKMLSNAAHLQLHKCPLQVLTIYCWTTYPQCTRAHTHTHKTSLAPNFILKCDKIPVSPLQDVRVIFYSPLFLVYISHLISYIESIILKLLLLLHFLWDSL